MSRISIKIVSSIVISILVVALTIGTISINRSSILLTEETHSRFLNMSEKYAFEFSMILLETENIIKTFSAGMKIDFNFERFKDDEEYRDVYMNKVGAILKLIAQQSSSIQGIYLVIDPEITGLVYESWYIRDKNSNYIYQEPEDISTFSPQNKDMKWYYEPIARKMGVWSRPYTDATIDVKMISYTLPIYSGDKLLGVAGIDLSFNDIFNTINNMVIYESGYGIMTDADYRVIVHPHLKEGTELMNLDNENYEHISNEMELNNSGVLLYEYQNVDKVMGFSKLSNGWLFLAVADLNDINSPIIKLRGIISLFVSIAILLGATTGLLLSRSISNQLKILHEMTELIGNGNFQMPEAPDSNDEIGQLAKSFRLMSRKLSASQNELLELNKDMKILAFHDPLTHLPNRRSGMDSLNEILQNYNKKGCDICGIMFIDLDNFKEINDTMGHDIGDQLLTHTADVMNHQISSSDILCRIGGDEFLVIFRQVPSLELVEAMAERIRKAVEKPVILNSLEIHSGCSIGIAVIDNNTTNLQTILKHADLALYSVKNSGRNNYKIYQG